MKPLRKDFWIFATATAASLLISLLTSAGTANADGDKPARAVRNVLSAFPLPRLGDFEIRRKFESINFTSDKTAEVKFSVTNSSSRQSACELNIHVNRASMASMISRAPVPVSKTIVEPDVLVKYVMLNLEPGQTVESSVELDLPAGYYQLTATSPGIKGFSSLGSINVAAARPEKIVAAVK